MKDEIFKQFQQSVTEATAIEHNELAPARVTIYFDPHEIKHIRTGLKLTQEQFFNRFGIPVKTIRHWEQGRRRPDRAAMAFYQILKEKPKAALEAFGW